MTNASRTKLLIFALTVIFIAVCAFIILYKNNAGNSIFFSKTEEDKIIGEKEKVKVQRIIDGDTVELTDGRKVRYIGIDTAELGSAVNDNECFALEAAEKNRELTEGKNVLMEKDVSDTDQYGRLLRYVYLKDNTFINLELVKSGFAASATFPPDVKYQANFSEAEQKARAEGLGMWSACPDY